MSDPSGVRKSCEELTPELVAEHLEAGYRLVTIEDVMLHDLDAVEVAPAPPALAFEPWGQRNIPSFFEAYCSAFAGRPGFPDWSMERWSAWTCDEETFRPDLSRVARTLAGQPIAFITCDDTSGEPDAGAYIIQVGVHPHWRRLGIGRHLVTAVLAVWRSEGRTSVLSHVHVNNVASARLLEGTGFRKIRQRGVFERAQA
jgi:ribosomal protein S18 acetylase RimI-like enzyme